MYSTTRDKPDAAIRGHGSRTAADPQRTSLTIRVEEALASQTGTTQRTVADGLRELRLAAGMTIEALSERSQVSVRGISDIERGVSTSPRQSTLVQLADALSLDDTDRRWLINRATWEREQSALVVPTPHSDFVGREQELVDLADTLLVNGALAIITGAPGIGKTSLASKATSRSIWKAPVLMVDLAGDGTEPKTPLDVLRALLGQARPDDPMPATLDLAAQRWRDVCAAAHPNVLLDNAGQESQVRPVLVEGIGFIVVTSRRSLAGLSATRRLVLQPLTHSDSVRLLERVIPETQRSERSLSELAELCSGSPLALRIAGNHVASRPGTRTADYAARLGDEQRRIPLLAAGDLSVEAAFSLSYNGLSADAARVFRVVSMISGRTFDARLAAAGVPGEVEGIEHLLDHLVESGFLETAGSDRYRMHDLTRVYGRFRLSTAEGAALVSAAQRAWLLEELARAAAVFTAQNAWTCADPVRTRVVEQTADRWIRTEVEHWWPAVQDAGRTDGHRAVAHLATLMQDGFAHQWAGWGNWTEFFEVAVASARVLDDDVLIARLLGTLHWANVVEHGDAFDGVPIAAEIIRRARSAGDSTQLWWGYHHLAWAHLRRRDASSALAALDDAEAALSPAADMSFSTSALPLRSAALAEAGDFAGAERLLASTHANLEDHRPDGRQRNARMVSLEALSRIATRAGRHDLAVAAADTQLALAELASSDYLRVRALFNRASALLSGARTVEARQDIGTARAIVAMARQGDPVASMQRMLSDLAATAEAA